MSDKCVSICLTALVTPMRKCAVLKLFWLHHALWSDHLSANGNTKKSRRFNQDKRSTAWTRSALTAQKCYRTKQYDPQYDDFGSLDRP